MSIPCAKCEQMFTDMEDFQQHPCVQNAMTDREGRLNRMLASGACTQEYYDEQMHAVNGIKSNG